MLPRLPRIRVKCTGTHTLNNAVDTVVNWDNSPDFSENIGYDTSTNEFTIQVSGVYLINAYYGFPNLTNTGTVVIYISRDSGSGFSQVAAVNEPDNPAGQTRLSIEYLAQLDKNDKIKVTVLQVQSPAANATNFTIADYSFLNIQMLDRL